MDKMREEFESWAKSEGICLANWYDIGQYADTRARYSWQAWQASRTALVVELPDHVNDMDSAPMLYDSVVEQLDALGIKYE